jgi:hypothetical protein
MRKRSGKELPRCVIGKNRERGTHRMQANLAEHKGRDIEERADSWELEHELRSTSIGTCGINLHYRIPGRVSCEHSAVSYTYKTNEGSYLPRRAPLTFPDLRSRNSTRL